MIGYSVWCKQDMICWLLDGITKVFSPADTEIAFHFDACTDDSVAVFDHTVPQYLLWQGGWKPEQVHKIVSTSEVREVGGHNKLIDLFMASDCDLLIVAQDDQRLTQDVRSHLQSLVTLYGDRLGVVGGRDGFNAGYSDFTGSNWSESQVFQRVLHGQFAARKYLNSGPVVYNKTLVQKVGKLDEEFRAYYVWDDYGARANKAGLINGVMGMDLIHRKFGRLKATEWCDYSGADIARLHAKHPVL